MGKEPVRLLILSCLAVCFTGCGTRAKAGHFVLEVALPGAIEPPNSDAQNGYTTIVSDWIFEPILRVAEDGSSAPGITSVTARLPDGRVQLALRLGATFSDGSPVTAEDVVRALKHHDLNAAIENGMIVAWPKAMRIPVESILPTINIGRQRGAEDLGSGPFMVVKHEDNHFLLQRRVYAAGRINEIRLTSYSNEREAMAHVLRGDANLLPRIQERDVEFFQGVSRLRVVRGVGPNSIAIALNPKLPVEERLALAQALPTAELASVFDQNCRIWSRASAGRPMPPGRPLHVLAPGTDAELSRLGLAVRRTLGDRAGELSEPTPEGLVAAFTTGDFDLATMTPLIWPVGMAALSLHSGSQLNLLHYSNSDVDAALESGNWLRTLDAMDKDPSLVFICTLERIVVVDARIKNPVLGPWGMLERLPEWEVGE